MPDGRAWWASGYKNLNRLCQTSRKSDPANPETRAPHPKIID